MTETDPYTKIPNALLDRMAELGNAELRVLLAIVRRTAGWQKECDVISARQLAKTTGLTLRNTHTAIHALTDRGFIERRPVGKQTFCYSLKPLPVGIQLDRIPSDTGTLGDTVPLPVGIQLEAKPYPLRHQQKKDLKKDLKKEGRAQARISLAPSDDLAYSHLAVITYHTYFKRWPDVNDARAIATLNPDFERWSAICDMWKKNRWDFLKVGNLINRYEKGNTNGPLQRDTRNGRHPDPRAEWSGFTETDLDKPF